MTPPAPDADVVVVGGGPVGLALGIALLRAGVDARVLEARTAPHRHSRSIGIHPPALEGLERLGVVDDLRREGVAIRVGRAVGWSSGEPRLLGVARFDRLHGRFPFVLALAQHRTESILEATLRETGPGALVRGAKVEQVEPTGDATVVVRGVHVAGGSAPRSLELTARYVVGCDGRDSMVRREAAVPLRRRPFPDAYLMGDVRDDSAYGDEAIIHLTRSGVLESFPLPGGLRRWVIATHARIDVATPDDLADLVARRIGLRLDPTSCTMVSPFGIERARAERLVDGRIVLAGDSGHVVPPIGGQGMNMGWLDAVGLAPALIAALRSGDLSPLRAWEARRQRAWRVAQRRAAWNVRLGRATRLGRARDLLVRAMLAPPVAARTAHLFTMHGLT